MLLQMTVPVAVETLSGVLAADAHVCRKLAIFSSKSVVLKHILSPGVAVSPAERFIAKLLCKTYKTFAYVPISLLT